MNESHDTISADQLLRVLRRRWWVIAQLMLAGAVVGALLAYGSVTRYEATATALVGPTAAGALQEGPSGGLTAAAAARLVRTRTVAERVARDLGGERAPSELLEAISTEADDSGVFVDITARGDTSTEAAALANAFAEQFIALRDDTVRARAQQAIAAAERRLDALPSGHPDRPALRSELAALRATAALGGIDAELVDPAVAGATSGDDDPLWAGLIGAGLGLLLGLVLVFSLEALDPRIRRLDELRRLAGAPQLAAMPSPGSGRRRHKEQLAVTSRREHFEHLRGALLALTGPEAHDRLIVTSSTDRDEGKTPVAANLAVSLARLGLRVCVVDADLREPSLGGYFGLEDGRRGLAEALRGTPLGDLLEHVDIQPDGRPNGSAPPKPLSVSVLAAGSDRSSAAELLAGHRMESLLEELDRDHDIVIIDCPPVLATSDALPLLRRASGTILVARHGHTPRRAITRASEVVAEAQGALLGVVATGVPKAELALEGHGPWPSSASAFSGRAS